MSPAKYRARKPTPPEEEAPRRPRWVKWAVRLAIAIGYMAIMWYIVFPWVDKTFVNQPAV